MANNVCFDDACAGWRLENVRTHVGCPAGDLSCLECPTRRGDQCDAPFVSAAITICLVHVHDLLDLDQTLVGVEFEIIIHLCQQRACSIECAICVVKDNIEDRPMIAIYPQSRHVVSGVSAGWTTFAESGGARQRGVTAWTVAATFRSCACLILSRRAIGTAARRASATAAVRGDARKGINKSQILTSDCVRAHASILEGCHAGRPPQVLTCRTICNTVYASCGLCATVLALEAWVAGSRP